MEWKNWLQNPSAKLLSLIAACVLWFYATSVNEYKEEHVFQIRYENMPPDLTSVEKLPQTVKLQVKSQGKFLKWRMGEAHLKVDLSGSQVGENRIWVSEAPFEHNKRVAASSHKVVPDEIFKENTKGTYFDADFDQLIVRDIPISASIDGQPAARHVIVGKELVEPNHARVEGPRRRVDEITLLYTEKIDIGGDRTTLRKRVHLEPPKWETVEITPMTVEVGITIEPELTQTLENVVLEPSEKLKDDWYAVFQPGAIQIEITGPRSIVEAGAKEVSSILQNADTFSLGTSILRFKEVRGRDIVYAPYETFPFVTAPPWGATEGPPPIGPTGPPGQKVPPAVRGEVICTLPLPGEIKILNVEPERIVLKIRKKSTQPELVRSPGLSP